MATGMFDAIDTDREKRHQLEHSYRFYFITNNESEDGSNVDKSVDDLHSTGSFGTVEQFWGYYSHLVRPNDLPENIDCCLFKGSTKPLEVDEANRGGGRWTLKLRKGLASRMWEELLLAIVGGSYSLDAMVTGATVGVRAEEDVLAVWTDHRDREATLRVREGMIKALNLPPGTFLEFKRHTSAPAPPAVSGGGNCRYSVAQLLAYKDHCPDPPVYVWDSLEAAAELRPGGSGYSGFGGGGGLHPSGGSAEWTDDSPRPSPQAPRDSPSGGGGGGMPAGGPRYDGGRGYRPREYYGGGGGGDPPHHHHPSGRGRGGPPPAGGGGGSLWD